MEFACLVNITPMEILDYMQMLIIYVLYKGLPFIFLQPSIFLSGLSLTLT